jgi:hypothetical protein
MAKMDDGQIFSTLTHTCRLHSKFIMSDRRGINAVEWRILIIVKLSEVIITLVH